MLISGLTSRIEEINLHIDDLKIVLWFFNFLCDDEIQKKKCFFSAPSLIMSCRKQMISATVSREK